MTIGRKVMEGPQEAAWGGGGGHCVMGHITLPSEITTPKKLNEDEFGDTRAEGVLEIPVVDGFGVLLGPIQSPVPPQGQIESRVANCPTMWDVD